MRPQAHAARAPPDGAQKQKEPGHLAGLFSVQCCRRSELPAQAAPDDIDPLRNAPETDVRFVEVVMQVFGPQEHMFDELIFKPRSRDPTELAGTGRDTSRVSKLRMTPTGACGAIGEQTREEDVADPRARRGQFVSLPREPKERALDV